MRASVQITTPPGLARLLAQGPQVVLPALAAEMDRQNELTIGQTVRRRMSFSRQQKPTAEGTRVFTGLLRRSLNRSDAQIAGSGITSAIGSNVRYFGKLEQGGTEQVRAHTRQGPRRFATGDGQRATRGLVTALGGFTRKGTLRSGTAIRELDRGRINVRAHSRTYRGRRMLGRTIEERGPAYGTALQLAAVRALEGGAR